MPLVLAVGINGERAELAQVLERRLRNSGLCDGHKIATQRKQAAQEGGRIHVGMAACIERRDQTRLGRAGQLGVQCAYRKAAQAVGQVRCSCCRWHARGGVRLRVSDSACVWNVARSFACGHWNLPRRRIGVECLRSAIRQRAAAYDARR